MLNAYSAIGKDLDSLADLVSFGVAPAAVFSSMLHQGFSGQWGGDFWALTLSQQVLVLLPFVLVVFSALRLAKFNNDSRQTENFIGLTTTATGMFTVSLAYWVYHGQFDALPWNCVGAVLGLVAVFSALLVNEIPMFSFTLKHLRWQVK